MSMTTGGGPLKADINMTPMIDVLLVLIIIFLVVTPQTQRGLQTAVPQPSNDTHPPPPFHDVIIDIHNDGTYRLNNEPRDLEGVYSGLRSLMAAGPDRAVFVRGEKGMPYQPVAEMVDLATTLGARRVALLTN